MAIDTSKTMKIRLSPWKLLALLAVSLVFTVGCGVEVFQDLNGAAAGIYQEVFDFGGVLFFGFGFVATVIMAIRWRGPVVTLSPDGIRDIRMSPELINWRDVNDITTLRGDDPEMQAATGSLPVSTAAADRQIRRTRFMMLAVAPGIKERIFAGHRMGEWALKLDQKHGVEGIAINPEQLSVGYDKLFAAARAYWQAAGGGQSGPT
ncbi:MAG: hypothetical protein LJE67_09795 [Salaquimonas sp.]|nr:hypothetical protein [Salaquimonas sp.]